MQTLWAPWRIKFIEELRSSCGDCVFCELGMSEGDDRTKLILHRGEKCFVLMNKYPYNSGHLLVLPFRHVSGLCNLTKEEMTEMMSLTASCVDILGNVFSAEGFNCGMNIGKVAGAGIADHVHQHVVPRWVGDSNFLPVLGETRSIPDYLESTYDKLIGEFRKIK